MAEINLFNNNQEHIANRQYAKIQFLQQENQQLLEQNKDLLRSLHLNKEALKISFEFQKNNTTESTAIDDSNKNIYQQLLIKLNNENQTLHEQLQKAITDRNTSQTQLLIQQQIAQEQLNFQKDLISDLEEKLLEIGRLVQDKEYTLQEIEKSRPIIQEKEGMYLKIKEIITPHEQSVRLNEELENTRNILNKLTQECQTLTSNYQIITEQNHNLRRELSKVKICLKNQVSFNSMKEWILQMEPKGSDPAKEDFYYQVEDAMNQKQEEKEALRQYVTQIDKQFYLEKITKTEKQVKNYKELYEKEKINVTLMQQQMEELIKTLKLIEKENQLLINAIKAKDLKLTSLLKEKDIYRKEKSRFMDLIIRKRRPINVSLHQLNVAQKFQVPIKENIITTNRDQDQKEINVSILEEQLHQQQNHNLSPKQQQIDQQDKSLHIDQMTLDECKFLLLNCAKELYLNQNLRNNFKQNFKRTHQRGLSDPFDYFTKESLVDDRVVKPIQVKQEPQKKQQKDQPFASDMSVIQGLKKREFANPKKKSINRELSFISQSILQELSEEY